MLALDAEVEISLDGSASLGVHSAIPFVTAPDCGLSSRSDKRMSTSFEYGARLTTVAVCTIIALLRSQYSVIYECSLCHIQTRSCLHEIVYEYSEML